MFPCKCDFRLPTLHYIEKHIQKIPGLPRGGAAAALLLPGGDDVLEQGVVSPLDIQRPLLYPLEIEVLAHPDDVRHVEFSEDLRHLANHRPRRLRLPLRPRAPDAQHHVRYHIAGQLHKLLRQVEALP